MSETIQRQTSNLERARRGFTLTEILVTIGIIVILIAIVVPTVSKVQKSARVAGVQAQLSGLQGAITRYQQDHGALPGPFSNDQLRNPNLPAMTPPTNQTVGFVHTLNDTNGIKRITGTENLVLALLGGLVLEEAAPGVVRYDPAQVGNGPMNLNSGQLKKFPAYIEAANLSWRVDDAGLKTGDYKDNLADASDSIIPEFVDTFPNPMPILYLRAKRGYSTAVTPPTAAANPVITNVDDPANGVRGHYDYSQFVGYVMADAVNAPNNYIGEGKSIDPNDYKPDSKKPTNLGVLPHGLTAPNLARVMDKADATNYEYPYNSYVYLKNPSSPTGASAQPRQKDGYILISAGTDRVYGTPDDITNFGSVNE